MAIGEVSNEDWRLSFRVETQQEPQSEEEMRARLHYYVYHSVMSVARLLDKALIEIRQSAGFRSTPDLQRMALKSCKREELNMAVKELWCIWVHLDAVEQGGEQLQPWLMHFFQLALAICDQEIPSPKGLDVLQSYNCEEEALLFNLAALQAARRLGYGAAAEEFSSRLRPILSGSDSIRQNVLEEAMTLPVDRLRMSMTK